MGHRRNFYISRPPAFPQAYYVGYIGFIIGIVQAWNGYYTQSAFILCIAFVILLFRPWILLNLNTNTIVYFLACIPYRIKRIDQIVKILFTEGKVNQTLNSRGNTSTIRYDLFSIKLQTNSETITLKTGRNKNKLSSRAGKIATEANVPCEDFANS